MRLETARDEFLGDMRDARKPIRKRATPATLVRYREELTRFIHWVTVTTGKASVLQFNGRLVEDYRDFRSNVRNVSVNTLSLDSVILRAFAAWGAARRYWRAEDVADLPYIQKASTLPRPHLPTERDRLLLLTLPPDDAAARGLLIFGGLRNGEVRAVRLKDVYPPHERPDGTIPARIHVFGKGARERTVYLHPDGWADVRPHFRARLAEGQGDDPLLVKPDGSPWTDEMLWRRVKWWGHAAAVEDIKPHRLRHGLATDMLDSGADIVDVQKVLGHASVATTQIYTKVSNERLAAAMMRLPGRPKTPPRDSGAPDLPTERSPNTP